MRVLALFFQAWDRTMEKLTVYYDRDVVRGQAFGNYLQGFGEVGIAAHNVKRSAWFKSWVITC
jgi:hypothetical protein